IMTRSPWWKTITRSFTSFMDNDLTTSAAAVSYFSMLALFPSLLLLLVASNRVFGPEAVEKYIIGKVLEFLPGTHTFVRRNLDSIYNLSAGLIASCIVIVLWAASWMFTVIEKALNRIWGTAPRSFLHGRAVNFAVMSLVFLLLMLLALFTASVSAIRTLADNIPLNLGETFASLTGYVWQLIFVAASAAVTISLFTLLYKLLPNTRVSLREALTGAIVAGVMWEGAKFGFAYLIPYFNYDVLYGSIGAGVAVLSWVYFSSNIMLFGAQFTALLHREHLFNASIKTAPTASVDSSATAE
ncbi:MAG: YihY/virulence factor BrkB family protein, partial [Acidobacteriota bacterium]